MYRPVGLAAAVSLFVLLLVPVSPALAGTTTCEVTGSTMTVLNTSNGSNIRLQRANSGSGAEILLFAFVKGQGYVLVDCAGDPHTVDSITNLNFTAQSEGSHFTVDLANGQFAPGAQGSESTNEVKIQLNFVRQELGNFVSVTGSPGADTLTAGGGGNVDMNGDGDQDITPTQDADSSTVRFVFLEGGGGDDSLSSAGSPALGGSLYTFVSLFGGDGNDLLQGGDAMDVLKGFEGNDTELGGGGADLFLQADDQDGSDVIDGQDGLDAVYYGDRGVNVSVTNDGVADDGEPGENDNVMPDTESALTISDDTVVQDDNSWNANAGDDFVTIVTDPDADLAEDVTAAVTGGGKDELVLDLTVTEGGEPQEVSLVTEGGGDLITGTIGGQVDNATVLVLSGPGSDTVKLTNTPTNGVSLEIITGGGGDVVKTGPLADDIDLGDGNDKASGGAGKDKLLGGGGDDVLTGGGGADVLNGGPGYDICDAGAGDTTKSCEKII